MFNVCYILIGCEIKPLWKAAILPLKL